MALFDSNQWYQLTEAHVYLSSAYQSFGGTALGFTTWNPSSTGGKWQLLPSNLSASAVYTLRLDSAGPEMVLSPYYNASEVDSSKTQLELRPWDKSDLSQQWTFTKWASRPNFWQISNLGNGSRYHLDCHSDTDTVFMSGTSTATRVQADWITKARGEINNKMFSVSWLPSSTPTSSPTSSPTASPTHAPDASKPAPSATHPTSSNSSSSLSHGATIGLAVGLSLGIVVLLFLAVILFLSRKRRRSRSAAAAAAAESKSGKPGEESGSELDGAPVYHESPAREKVEMDPAQTRHELQSKPLAELPAPLESG